MSFPCGDAFGQIHPEEQLPQYEHQKSDIEMHLDTLKQTLKANTKACAESAQRIKEFQSFGFYYLAMGFFAFFFLFMSVLFLCTRIDFLGDRIYTQIGFGDNRIRDRLDTICSARIEPLYAKIDALSAQVQRLGLAMATLPNGSHSTT
ncbi:hypothetical protein niasHT_030896 [Heterodera trifolii]|uniref:Uncharacterized protein n=1 Tax=Heterodera trifolii TaxID=157864 RepID=A0ABD2HV02_9BILA